MDSEVACKGANIVSLDAVELLHWVSVAVISWLLLIQNLCLHFIFPSSWKDAGSVAVQELQHGCFHKLDFLFLGVRIRRDL